jgi:hypothetical protein
MPETRTYADRREYLIKAVSRRRKQLRIQAVKYKGDECSFCGYKRCLAALDFHHIDATQKEFGISLDGITRSWERVKKNSINVFSFAQIVTGKYMQAYCSPQQQC